MRELSAHAAAHHGTFSRDEARRFGLSDQRIGRLVADGLLVRLAPRTFAFAAAPPSWLRDARAATLTTGGVLSHRAAAHVHGIDGFPPRSIEVVVPKSRRPRTGELKIHRTTQFGLIEPVVRLGIPVTDVPRTILDLAATVSFRRLETAVDAVLRQELCEWHNIVDVLVRHSIQGRNGCGPLRALIDERGDTTTIPDSAWNRMAGRLLMSAGLPRPEYEWTITDRHGHFVGRVDLAYPAQLVAIELDSVRWHLNRRSFEHDPRRKNRLTLAGWTVLTFTYSDYRDAPHRLVSTVRAALQR